MKLFAIFSLEVTRTVCQVVRFFVHVKAPLVFHVSTLVDTSNSARSGTDERIQLHNRGKKIGKYICKGCALLFPMPLTTSHYLF